MIFDEIVLHNFSIYQGRQSVDLAPPSLSKPIVLFGGLNGGGKTSLLDALQLSLYGKSAHCSNRGTLNYDEFLRRCINRSTDPGEGAALEIQFRHVSDGKEHTYRIHRSWSAKGKNGVRECIEVVRDGKYDRVLTEAWEEYVEEFIPLRLSDLFFFDGEKIEGLADFDRSADLLSIAIQSLLGLDLVDKLSDDLIVIERRKKTALKNDIERQKIKELRSELERLEKLYSDLTTDRGEAQNALDIQQKFLKRIEERFQQEGGLLFESRDQIEKERAVVRNRLKPLEVASREIAAGPFPLLLISDLLDAVTQQEVLPS